MVLFRTPRYVAASSTLSNRFILPPSLADVDWFLSRICNLLELTSKDLFHPVLPVLCLRMIDSRWCSGLMLTSGYLVLCPQLPLRLTVSTDLTALFLFPVIKGGLYLALTFLNEVVQVFSIKEKTPSYLHTGNYFSRSPGIDCALPHIQVPG